MTSKAINGIKYWGQLLMLPIYWLSFLTPRDKKIWLFGSTFGRRFADNPRYLYLYASQHKKEEGIRPIWISHNKEVVDFLTQNGYEAYHYHSLKGIWYCLRGGIYIFDNYSKDISFWLSGGAVKFNLWHGTGNKRANHDNLFDKVRHPKNAWERFKTFPRRLSDEKPHHYTLATSEPLAEITASAFHTSLDHVIIDGYPRNDAMLDETFPNLCTQKEKKCSDYIKKCREEGKMIDFYMPTFRESEKEFFGVMDLGKFNDFLICHNIIFVIKLHPKSKLKQEFSEIHASNIYVVDSEVDPYTFLRDVDIMTADYSSAYSDFMLLDRPVVAFYYDFQQYTENTRDSYVPFEQYMPEVRAANMEELMECTLQVLESDVCKEKRAVSRNRMFRYQDAGASARLMEKIRIMMEK